MSRKAKEVVVEEPVVVEEVVVDIPDEDTPQDELNEPVEEPVVKVVDITDYPGTVRAGHEGKEVVLLQTLLVAAGYNLDRDVSGVAGPWTTGSLKQFAAANGLLSDGILTPELWTLLKA